MWGWIGLGVAGVLVVGAGLWVALVVSMRTKYRPALDAIRRMNRRFTNPRVLRTAGQVGVSASVVHHVGRSTGTPYATPIAVLDTDDGFVVALPYGTSPDWLKNVRAAGSAVIHREGQSYPVTDPQVVLAADVDRHLSGKDRRVNRIYGIDQFLVMRRVDADVAAGSSR
jgi:deazaflavin-dependent oxidoreductase (nitroreductase family)